MLFLDKYILVSVILYLSFYILSFLISHPLKCRYELTSFISYINGID